MRITVRPMLAMATGLVSFAAAPAFAGEQAAIYNMDLPDLLFSAPDSGLDLAAAIEAKDVHIVPTSTDGSLADSFRYNLQYLDVSAYDGYGGDRFLDQSGAIIWDVGIAYGLTTVLGVSSWGWGTSEFRFQNEGWFGDNTDYAGVDKIAHAYSGYLLTEYFTQRIAHSTNDTSGAFVTGAILGMGIQTYVEVIDGFSGGHGFSYEDLIADAVGVGFSMLRSSVPGLREKLDFRMEYIPSGEKGFSPVLDYEGQKYLLALKLSGFESFQDSPLRFVELQAGYFARGYSDEERAREADRRREPYIAIGINLNEIINGTGFADTTPGLMTSRSLEYLQVPYTYAATSQQ